MQQNPSTEYSADMDTLYSIYVCEDDRNITTFLNNNIELVNLLNIFPDRINTLVNYDQLNLSYTKSVDEGVEFLMITIHAHNSNQITNTERIATENQIIDDILFPSLHIHNGKIVVDIK